MEAGSGCAAPEGSLALSTDNFNIERSSGGRLRPSTGNLTSSGAPGCPVPGGCVRGVSRPHRPV
eukprot:4836260-Prymnesium_polylepis.1